MNQIRADLVVDAAGLAALAEHIGTLPWVALDTEFIREETYFPRLCLLQLGWPEGAACVDPLAVGDLSPLLAALARPSLVKVMHASRQDLEILWLLTGSVPGPVFDTQIAAPLLGLPEQVGYAGLVERLLGIRLDKSHTRADWTRRPLPDAWLEYALADVVHLAALYPLLHERLEARGRLAWLAEDFAGLLDPRLYRVEPAEAWLRIRPGGRMNARQWGALRALAEWREELARREDRPRGWLLKDESLIDVARALPATREELSGIRGLADRTLARHGEALLAAVARGRAAPFEPEATLRGEALTPEVEALVDAALALVRLRAAEESVQPTLLAGRRELERWAGGDAEVEALRGWRGALIAEDLDALRSGRLALVAVDGRLTARPLPAASG